MARTCTACRHKQAKELNKALMKGEPVRDIAERFGLKPTAVQKHKAHISALISERKEEVTTSALQDIKRYIQRAETLWRACDRFLRDPDNPDEYDLGPRDRDIEVIYEEKVPAADGFKSVMKRAMLSQLLDKTGKHVIGSRYRVADPRELVLKSLERLESQLKILGGLTGRSSQHRHGRTGEHSTTGNRFASHGLEVFGRRFPGGTGGADCQVEGLGFGPERKYPLNRNFHGIKNDQGNAGRVLAAVRVFISGDYRYGKKSTPAQIAAIKYKDRAPSGRKRPKGIKAGVRTANASRKGRR